MNAAKLKDFVIEKEVKEAFVSTLIYSIKVRILFWSPTSKTSLMYRMRWSRAPPGPAYCPVVVVKQILSDKDLLALETVYCFSQPIFLSRYIFQGLQ